MNALADDSETHARTETPRWQRIALLVAGLQCLIWGVFIIAWPELFLWQGTGLVIVLFGVGYTIASTNPMQHWVIILIGMLSKSLGPIGMAWTVYQEHVSRRVLFLIPINDLIWLSPFALILLQVYRKRMSCVVRRS